MEFVTKLILKEVYKPRPEWSHKGMFGRLACVVGSERLTGSPIFVGMAAYRAGCDLVFLIGPRRAMDVAANYSPVLITQPLEGKRLERRHVKNVISFIKEVSATAMVIGPSLWRAPPTRRAIIEIIKKVDLPMVIDADAIRAISAAKKILTKKKAIVTPHSDEFYALTGIKPSLHPEKRIKIVEEQAKLLKTVILLKGRVDVISDGSRTALNKTGVPALTVGGVGDTLAGVCGALLAKNIDVFTAACAAAYINGLAGEFAAKEFGVGLLPTDLIEKIPEVIKPGF
ncbi:MAG: NAD(P)H-hydrate dehydratase [Candidatus Aenigmarchaeota archaeon]|nr:NAD(P)H-hydrate dehydratase [Candidatus Aenigmarchaeota archaeon]